MTGYDSIRCREKIDSRATSRGKGTRSEPITVEIPRDLRYRLNTEAERLEIEPPEYVRRIVLFALRSFDNIERQAMIADFDDRK